MAHPVAANISLGTPQDLCQEQAVAPKKARCSSLSIRGNMRLKQESVGVHIKLSFRPHRLDQESSVSTVPGASPARLAARAKQARHAK